MRDRVFEETRLRKRVTRFPVKFSGALAGMGPNRPAPSFARVPLGKRDQARADPAKLIFRVDCDLPHLDFIGTNRLEQKHGDELFPLKCAQVKTSRLFGELFRGEFELKWFPQDRLAQAEGRSVFRRAHRKLPKNDAVNS